MHMYIVRHADPDYESDTLTEHGHREAAALAPRLGEFGITHIYSSPLGRAAQTAEYTADLLDLKPVEQEWLKEPDFQIVQEGKKCMIWDAFGETIRNAHPLPTLENWDRRPPFDSTGIGDFWRRFRASADEFTSRHGYTRQEGRYRIDRPNDDRPALFCHNGTLLMLLAHLLEIPPSLAWCGFYGWPSSVTDIYFSAGAGSWAVPRALHVADVSHLYKAGLKPQARGMGDRCDEYY